MMQAKRSHKKSEDPEDLIPAVVVDGGSPPLQFNHHDPSLQPQHQQNNDIANNNISSSRRTRRPPGFSPTSPSLPSSPPPPQPPPPLPPAFPPSRRFESFVHFSRLNRPKATTAVKATVLDSSDTPMVARVSDDATGHDVARVGAESTSAGVRDAAKCDLMVTSSLRASSLSTKPIPLVKSPKAAPPLPSIIRKTTMDVQEERKRIGSRRRDQINEKMRALQELIPHCNKADKASMLDEAIEYLKSLQMQVQMMLMGYGMMAMMYPYPGLQQYMPHMGMGLGVGMGMEMGMNHPMVQFPHVFTGSRGVGPPMCPSFRFPIPVPNNQPNTVLSSVSPRNSNYPRIPGFMDPYQQFL